MRFLTGLALVVICSSNIGSASAQVYRCAVNRICHTFMDCPEGIDCEISNQCLDGDTYAIGLAINPQKTHARISDDKGLLHDFDVQPSQPWTIAVGTNASGDAFNSMFTLYRTQKLVMTTHVYVTDDDQRQSFPTVLNILGFCAKEVT
ncbi:hypothetical protein [Sedimentitalea sp.]|uniref:hypothetical protein n=1 Tax=Sedimentitalea sp. TaxID=2048915 RepID=UPI003296C243